MVTDEQFLQLKEQIKSLEKKIAILGGRLAEIELGRQSYSVKSRQEEKKRDTSKYRFNNKVYNKRSLVYACVKWLMEENTISSGETLRKMLPDRIQGPLGVVRKVEDILIYKGAYKRFYLKDEQLLECEDGRYAVCCQWDNKNIKQFIKSAQSLGCEIERYEEEF